MTRTQPKVVWRLDWAGAVRTASLAFFFLLCLAGPCQAYSVLTHEEIVDLLWQDQIQPLLKQRFPTATDENLREAHGYAYCGCVLQDMGYYPFGSHYFSDLVHYVRSGDFVVNLILESSNLNEYAFALGALSHYAADNSGHPPSTGWSRSSSPVLEKSMGSKSGTQMTQRRTFAPSLDSTWCRWRRTATPPTCTTTSSGSQSPKDLLDRAFFTTYSLHLDDVFGDTDLAIGTFRRAVS